MRAGGVCVFGHTRTHTDTHGHTRRGCPVCRESAKRFQIRRDPNKPRTRRKGRVHSQGRQRSTSTLGIQTRGKKVSHGTRTATDWPHSLPHTPHRSNVAHWFSWDWTCPSRSIQSFDDGDVDSNPQDEKTRRQEDKARNSGAAAWSGLFCVLCREGGPGPIVDAD